jgi:hypothetical protein
MAALLAIINCPDIGLIRDIRAIRAVLLASFGRKAPVIWAGVGAGAIIRSSLDLGKRQAGMKTNPALDIMNQRILSGLV